MKKNLKHPWLTNSGVEIPTLDLKVICRTWGLATWESYLKWYQSPSREAIISLAAYNTIGEDHFESIFESLAKSETPAKRNLIKRMLSQIPAREAEILNSIYLEGRTHADVAADFKLSRQRVTQLKASALTRLKRGLQGDKLATRQFMRGVMDSISAPEIEIWYQPMVPPPVEPREYVPGEFVTEIERSQNHSLREAVLHLSQTAQHACYLRFWCGQSLCQAARRLRIGINKVSQICDASVSKIKRMVIQFQTGRGL